MLAKHRQRLRFPSSAAFESSALASPRRTKISFEIDLETSPKLVFVASRPTSNVNGEARSIVRHESVPSSTRYRRPARIRFVRETNDQEFEYTENRVKNPKETEATVPSENPRIPPTPLPITADEKFATKTERSETLIFEFLTFSRKCNRKVRESTLDRKEGQTILREKDGAPVTGTRSCEDGRPTEEFDRTETLFYSLLPVPLEKCFQRAYKLEISALVHRVRAYKKLRRTSR